MLWRRGARRRRLGCLCCDESILGTDRAGHRWPLVPGENATRFTRARSHVGAKVGGGDGGGEILSCLLLVARKYYRHYFRNNKTVSTSAALRPPGIKF